jgi:hypothetical protein
MISSSPFKCDIAETLFSLFDCVQSPEISKGTPFIPAKSLAFS